VRLNSGKHWEGVFLPIIVAVYRILISRLSFHERFRTDTSRHRTRYDLRWRSVRTKHAAFGSFDLRRTGAFGERVLPNVRKAHLDRRPRLLSDVHVIRSLGVDANGPDETKINVFVVKRYAGGLPVTPFRRNRARVFYNNRIYLFIRRRSRFPAERDNDSEPRFHRNHIVNTKRVCDTRKQSVSYIEIINPLR